MQNERVRIKKEDKVKVIAGKDRGKIGKVIRVDLKKKRVLVENVNMIKRHLRPGPQHRQGGIVESEGLIHWSNVMVMCSKCVASVRIKMMHLEDGRKVRVCAKCNEILDA